MHNPSFPLAVLVVTHTGSIVSCNAGCARLFGRTEEELQGILLSELGITPAGGVAWALAEDAVLCGCLQHGPLAGTRIQVTVSSHTLTPALETRFSLIVCPDGPVDTPVSVLDDAPLQEIIDGLPGIFYVIEATGHLLLWNQRLQDMLGVPPEQLPSMHVTAFFPPAERDYVQEQMRAAFEVGHTQHTNCLLSADGRGRIFLFNCVRIRLGAVTCVFGTGLDVTPQKQLELELMVRQRALHSSDNAIAITRCEGENQFIEYVNPAFEKLTGYSAAEVLGRDPRFLALAGVDGVERARVRAALLARASVQATMRNVRKNGDIFWNAVRLDPIANAEGTVTHYVGVLNDVTAERHGERRLRYLATHDQLTGLGNRTHLNEHGRHLLNIAREKGCSVSLLFLDLDRFKYINDAYGHAAGDEVLLEVARRLRHCVRDDDMVVRLGGDEFVLFLMYEPGTEDSSELVARVTTAVAAPFLSDGRDLTPGVSIGVAEFPGDGHDLDTLLAAADTAMYQAKFERRRNRA